MQNKVAAADVVASHYEPAPNKVAAVDVVASNYEPAQRPPGDMGQKTRRC